MVTIGSVSAWKSSSPRSPVDVEARDPGTILALGTSAQAERVNFHSLTSSSEGQDSLAFPNQIGDLRKNFIFQLRAVRHPRVQGCNSSHRCVEICKEFIRNSRRQFRAVPPREQVLMRNEHPARSLYGFADRLPVVGRERSEVDHFDRSSFFALFEL